MSSEKFPEDIPKGSSLLASLQKYLQTHVEYAESQGQYRTADNIHKVSEHLANFELQAKSVDELLIEILEALNFRRNRSNRFAMIVHNNEILEVCIENPGEYKVSSAENILSKL